MGLQAASRLKVSGGGRDFLPPSILPQKGKQPTCMKIAGNNSSKGEPRIELSATRIV